MFNLVILVVAGRRLPEFRGYRGRRFPGQQPPAPPRIAPRRLQLPPTFAQDQVSCDWWRAGHVTKCSPLIGPGVAEDRVQEEQVPRPGHAKLRDTEENICEGS